MTDAAPTRSRTFKKFTFRGIDLEALMDMSSEDVMDLMHSRVRRRFSRGIRKKPLALIKRLATFQLRLAEELGLTAPAYVSEMVVKLAPFATARKRNKDGQLVQVNSPTLNISKNGCSGSESCDPFFL